MGLLQEAMSAYGSHLADSIQELRFVQNAIGPEGVHRVGAMLRICHNLTTLDIGFTNASTNVSHVCRALRYLTDLATAGFVTSTCLPCATFGIDDNDENEGVPRAIPSRICALL